MGVHGLWELLSPAARRIPIETLAQRRLAVDASIWLTQFVKAMRDQQGTMIRNAHLLGLFRRMCKLLFFRVKPVFVFDGGAPAIKRRTLASRRMRRDKQAANLQRTAEKLLLSQLKSKALQNLVKNVSALQRRDRPQSVVADSPQSPHTSSSQETAPGTEDRDFVVEKASDAVIDLEACDAAGEVDTSKGENRWNSKVKPTTEILEGPIILPAGDLDPIVLSSLPPEIRYELALEMRERFRLEGRGRLIEKEAQLNDFSAGQIEKFLQGTRLTKTLEEARHALGCSLALNSAHGQRIASDENRSFLLVKGSSAETAKQALLHGSTDVISQDKKSPVQQNYETHATENASDTLFLNTEPEGPLMPPEVPIKKWKGKEPLQTRSVAQDAGEDVLMDCEWDVVEIAPITKAHTREQQLEPWQTCDEESAGVIEFSISIDHLEVEALSQPCKCPSVDPPTEIQSQALDASPICPANQSSEAAIVTGIHNDHDMTVSAYERPIGGTQSRPSSPSAPELEDRHVIFENSRVGTSLEETGTFYDSCASENESSAGHAQQLQGPDSRPISSVARRPPSPTHQEVQAELALDDAFSDTAHDGAEWDIDSIADDSLIENQDNHNKQGGGCLPDLEHDVRKDWPSEAAHSAVGSVEPVQSAHLDAQQGQQQPERDDIGDVASLEAERKRLQAMQRRAERDIDSVTDEMFAESQELLRLFGCPYIVSPMEAEAQCAALEQHGLVDGIITDDSDVFLFGGQNVYRNMFDQKKLVEHFKADDFSSELGMDREKLISLAMLLGSDYAEGIRGIGIVNAMEVVDAFTPPGGDEGLREFREWLETVNLDDRGDWVAPSTMNDTTDPQKKKRTFMFKHRNMKRNWVIRGQFPSSEVRAAYMQPQVDSSMAQFGWGQPDFDALKRFCHEKFMWSFDKTDELLQPILNALSGSEKFQTRIDSYFQPHRYARIRSSRLATAVRGLTHTPDLVEELIVPKSEEPETKKKSVRKRKVPAMDHGHASGEQKRVESGGEQLDFDVNAWCSDVKKKSRPGRPSKPPIAHLETSQSSQTPQQETLPVCISDIHKCYLD